MVSIHHQEGVLGSAMGSQKVTLYIYKVYYTVKRWLCLYLGRYGCVMDADYELAMIDWHLKH